VCKSKVSLRIQDSSLSEEIERRTTSEQRESQRGTNRGRPYFLLTTLYITRVLVLEYFFTMSGGKSDLQTDTTFVSLLTMS
jgi:hypothetical protein